MVTEVVDANTFYVQTQAGGRAAWLAEQLASMNLDGTPALLNTLKAGDKCLAKFAADGQWYRAVVEKVNVADPTTPVYDVGFIDFGNKDRVKGASLRPCPPDLAAPAAQAQPASLAFVKAPALDADYGVEAAQLLSQLVGGGQRLTAYIEKRERIAAAAPAKGGKSWGAVAAGGGGASGPMQLSLTVVPGGEGDDKESVNEALVAAGLAKVVDLPKHTKVGWFAVIRTVTW